MVIAAHDHESGGASPAGIGPPGGRPIGAEWLRLAAGRLIDLVLPPRCAACGAAVTDVGLCGACWAQADFIAAPFCDRLGTPFPFDPGPYDPGPYDPGLNDCGPDAFGAPLISPAALANPPVYRHARAVARYEGPARALVQALKFQDRLELAGVMATLMSRAGAALLDDCDVVVPIPLHRRRLFGRRFNQAAVLAEPIAGRAGRDYAPAAIRRVKPTRHQIGLSAAERRRNVAGAFKVERENRPLIEGRRILLVDDVLTTGATADACARACLRAGAGSVDVLVFARVAAPV